MRRARDVFFDMPSAFTRHRCKQIRDQAERDNSSFSLGILFVGIALLVFMDAYIVSIIVRPSTTISLDAIELLVTVLVSVTILYIWSLRVQDQYQVLDIVAKPSLHGHKGYFTSKGRFFGYKRFSKATPQGRRLLIITSAMILLTAILILVERLISSQRVAETINYTVAQGTIISRGIDVVYTIIIFALGLLVVFALRREVVPSNYESVREQRLSPYVNSVIGILPRKGREGSAYPLFLDFDFTEEFKRAYAEPKANQYLEVEIQASSFAPLGGEMRQRLYPSSPLPFSTWTYFLATNGKHTINLLVRSVSVSHYSKQPKETKHILFRHEHTILAKGLLSTVWLPFITIIVSLVTMITTLMRAFGLY